MRICCTHSPDERNDYTFYIDQRGLFSDISFASNLVNAKRINLESCDISDVTPLSQLTQLEDLDISYNKIVDISCLENLNLESLEIGDNLISDISVIENMDKLFWLHACNNQITFIPNTEKLVNLKYLFLANNPITDISPLYNLNLVESDLSCIAITDLSPLYHMDNLTRLYLININTINDQAISELQSALPNCEIVY